jgi:hypothetical protein
MAGKTMVTAPLTLRIVVLDPPVGVRWALQRDRFELIAPDMVGPGELGFTFSIDVADANAIPPRLLGKCTQGPPGARFVYLNTGMSDGPKGATWTRRAKIPLKGVTAELIAATTSGTGKLLEARMAGTARDGGAACASIRLLTDWHLA